MEPDGIIMFKGKIMDPKEFYEEVWKTESTDLFLKENMEMAPIRRAKRRLIEKAIDKNTEKIIDLGCGAGYYTANLRKRGIPIEGYDISENAVTLASQMYPGPKYGVADITTIELNTPDTVILIDVLEHLQDDEHVLNECKKANKVVIMTDFSGKYDDKDYDSVDNPHVGHGGDYRLYGYQLVDRMKDLGFHVEDMYLQGRFTNWLTNFKYRIAKDQVESARHGSSKPRFFQKIVGFLMYNLIMIESQLIDRGEIICLNCTK
jgi:ubiquinone/menaquinone biosynthesis C-methylase UbiE